MTDRRPGFPNRLREERLARRLELYDIAALVRRDPSMVYRYETGRTAVPEHVWRALADHWETSVDWLMKR